MAVDIRARPAAHRRNAHGLITVSGSIVAGPLKAPSFLHPCPERKPSPPTQIFVPSTSMACIATSPRLSSPKPEHEIAILQGDAAGATTCTSERTGTEYTAPGSGDESARLSRKYGGGGGKLKPTVRRVIAQRETRVVEANSTGTNEDEGVIVLRAGFHRPSAELAGVRSPAPRYDQGESAAARRSQPETNPLISGERNDHPHARIGRRLRPA